MPKKIDWNQYQQVQNMWINWDYYTSNIRQAGVTECWPWQGPTHKQGYGMMGYFTDRIQPKRKMTVVHRITATIKYQRCLHRQDFVIHTCSNFLCQNPQHLVLGDASLRNQVMKQNGRNNPNKIRPRRTEPQQGRRYRFQPHELLWMRTATSHAIAERFGITRARASNLRYSVRTGFRWLDFYQLNNNEDLQN